MLMNMAYGAADKQEAVLMNDREQWLSTGNCDVCRRRKYCSKPCKPAQRRSAAELTSMIAGAVCKAAYRVVASDSHEEQ